MAIGKKALGSISPAYGLATGKGMWGQIAKNSPIAMAMGMNKDDEKKGQGRLRGSGVKRMRHGGKIDGCATKGKTKGAMR